MTAKLINFSQLAKVFHKKYSFLFVFASEHGDSEFIIKHEETKEQRIFFRYKDNKRLKSRHKTLRNKKEVINCISWRKDTLLFQ